MFAGLGSAGSWQLDLQDVGGYLVGLTGDGTYTYLTADLESDATTIDVEDTSAFDETGVVYIHREAISYSGKTATSFTGCSRLRYDDKDFARPHRIQTLQGAGITAQDRVRVRVSTQPGPLTGRWISLRVVVLDQGGYPVYDSAGRFWWEIWRGVITRCPPSPNNVGWTLTAEGLERLITDDPPTQGVTGRLAVGSISTPGAYGQTPVFIPAERRLASVHIYCDSADCLVDANYGINMLAGHESQFVPANQLLDAVEGSVLLGTSDVPVELSLRIGIGAWDQESPDMQALVRVRVHNWPYQAGELWVSLLLDQGGFWQQCGLAGDVTLPLAMANGNDGAAEYPCDELPMLTWVRPGDTELPCFVDSSELPARGFVELNDEIIQYNAIAAEAVIEGRTAYVLSGCIRGYAGTSRQEIRVRAGDDPRDVPEMAPVAVIGGGSGMLDMPDSGVWEALLQVLTGCSKEGNNSLAGAVSPYNDFPGLGISGKHLDGEALLALRGQIPLTGPIYGRVEDLRRWLSDALALEGYALAMRPIADGTARLTPVRTGAAGTGEVATVVAIDGLEPISSAGGDLGDIVNVLQVEDGRGNKIVWHDADSMAQYSVRQRREMRVPFASRENLFSTIDAAKRLFRLAGGRSYFRAEFGIQPGAGRFPAVGDLIDVDMPNPLMSGLWRIMHASQPLRGSGRIRVDAVLVSAWNNYLWAPTSAIISIDGSTITVASGDGPRYLAGATLWIWDSIDYNDGYQRTIASINGDVLTLNSVADLAEGDVVEHLSQSTSQDDDRYVWLVDAWTWGD
jgi:hypothetical protein